MKEQEKILYKTKVEGGWLVMRASTTATGRERFGTICFERELPGE